jgi:biopolymer transport protein ExbD
MFRRRIRSRVPALNTTSTADISFMLLVFFLVTTSIDSDRGLQRRLAPPPQSEEETELVVRRSDMMRLDIAADNRLTCDGEDITPEELVRRIETFVESKRTKHVLSVHVDRSATYDTYFAMQNAIMAAYNNLRDRYARQRYGRPYAECDTKEKTMVAERYPQRISETTEGGGR